MIQKFFVIVIFIFMSGCGFKPLYYNEDNYNNLSQISIAHITTGENPGKIDLSFRKALEQALYFGKESKTKKYLLDIKIRKTNTNFGTQKNSVDTRMIINIVSNFRLEEITSGKVVTQGDVYAYDSFKITNSPYSTLIAEEEGIVRMAKTIADEIKVRIVTFLNSKQPDETIQSQ